MDVQVCSTIMYGTLLQRQVLYIKKANFLSVGVKGN